MGFKPLTIVLEVLLLVAASPGWARTWTDVTGKYEVEAEMVELQEDAVVLRTSEGKYSTVLLERLSEADRNYLAQLTKPRWTMNVSQMTVPPAELTGSVQGKEFSADEVRLADGALTIRQRARSPYPSRTIRIHLFPKMGESVEEQKFQMPGDKGFRAPAVEVLCDRGGGSSDETDTYLGDYAMVLEFGQASRGKLGGKIYLCLPDDSKSFIAGEFEATAEGQP
jgi:hypothetical protein